MYKSGGLGGGEAFILVCFPFAMMFDCFLGVFVLCFYFRRVFLMRVETLGSSDFECPS